MNGIAQATNAAPSRLHSKRPCSDALATIVTRRFVVRAPGPRSTVVSGGVVSAAAGAAPEDAAACCDGAGVGVGEGVGVGVGGGGAAARQGTTGAGLSVRRKTPPCSETT